MLDIDGFRMDKGQQITVDAQGEFSDHMRQCASAHGKDNFCTCFPVPNFPICVVPKVMGLSFEGDEPKTFPNTQNQPDCEDADSQQLSLVRSFLAMLLAQCILEEAGSLQ